MLRKALGHPPEGFFHILRLPYFLLITVLLLLPALGAIPLHRAEIYFADAARTMAERADWLVPYFRGEPFFDKPVLTYWMMAAPIQLLGPSLAAARLSSVIATMFVVLVTVWLGNTLWPDGKPGLVSGWILLTSVPFIALGRSAMSDMPMTLFIMAAFGAAVALYQGILSPTPALLVFGAALGLGFLTKGPIAVLIPLLGLACLMWNKRAQRPAASSSALVGAVSAFLLLGFGWFVVIYLRLGPGPLEHFFIRENLARFSGSAHDTGRSVWFYLVTYLTQGAPWSFFLPIAAYHFLRRRPDSSARILLGWILLVGVFLSVSRGKLDYYLLPLYPPAALLIARYFCEANWAKAERALVSIILGGAAVVLLALPLGLLQLPALWRPSGLELAAVELLLAACGIACAIAAWRPSPYRTAAVLAAVVAGVLFVMNVSILPAFYAGQPNELLRQAVDKERLVRSEVTVAATADPLRLHRELLFDSRMILEEADDLESLTHSGRPYLFLASLEEARSLTTLPGIREIASYPYLPASALTFRGLLNGESPSRLVLLANFGS